MTNGRQSVPPSLHRPVPSWREAALARSEIITDAWEVTKTYAGRIAEWVLFGCMVANIVEIVASVPLAFSNIVMGTQVIMLDVGGFSLATMGEQAQEQGDDRAARKAARTGYFLIAVTILTLLLVTVGLLWSPAKPYTDMAEKGLILVRVVMTVIYAHVIHSLRRATAYRQPTPNQVEELATAFTQQVQELAAELARVQENLHRRLSSELASVRESVQVQLETELASVQENVQHAEAQLEALMRRGEFGLFGICCVWVGRSVTEVQKGGNMSHRYRAIGVSQDDALFHIEIEVELDPEDDVEDPIYTAVSELQDELDEQGIEAKYPPYIVKLS
jgi:hypothetical protein